MTCVCHMHTPTPSPLTDTIFACWAKKKTCVGVGCDKVCQKRFHCELSLMLGGHIYPTKILASLSMPHTSQTTFFTGVTKTQTSDTEKFRSPGCLENKDLPKTSDTRETQIPGCLENSDPQYFSNIATNYRPRAASLSLSHLQKRNFVLQKYRLSESSHWQNVDKTKLC